MLQNIGDTLKGQRWLAFLLLGLLILVFALWGAYGIVDLSFGTPSYALKVNGEEVPANQVQNAWQEQQSKYQQQLKADIPPAMRTKLQEQLLDQYVRETLVRQRATERGFRVDDQAVVMAYQRESAFQVGGKFDATAAKGMLAQIGMTPAGYEKQLRNSLQVGQLEQSLQIGDFMTQAEIARAFALENEQREVRYAILPLASYSAAVKIDDARAKAWYEAHAEDYLTPESVHLQYAELRLDTIAAALTVDPAELTAWYQQNQSRYVQAEKRHARHILITVGGAKDAAADAAALAKAQQVLKEARAGGDFGALAKKLSQDPGSAREGGDLGWALRGAYVQAFSDKLFAMKAGEISEPVKTQFGYHIIKLEEVQPERARTLSDARSQIEGDYRRERASDVFGDRQERVQQKLESSVGADLSALAQEFGLTVGEVPEYTHAGGGALGSNAELTSLVFSDTVLKDQRIGGPVALADDRMVIVKVLEHHKPQARALATVRADVEAAVRKEEGTRDARAAAESAVKELIAGASLDEVAKQLKITATPAAFLGRGDPQPPAQVRDAAFALAAPAAGKSTYEAIAMDAGGAAILAVLSVKPGAPGANAVSDQQLMGSFNQHHREAEFAAYLAEMQRNAKIRKNLAIFN
ncbi:MAG TPA: SurA N-terminal domain-containing protein [Steroidobacteraceae bacterium]|nr:SurA N-terminal domain-containing protein [Steroidobacteraceae bacterium]